MRVTFYDFEQVSANPLHGTTIDSGAGFARLLESHVDRDPFIAELVGEYGYKLTVGIGRREGCVQFGPKDGSLPYLMAVDRRHGPIDDDRGRWRAIQKDMADGIPENRLSFVCGGTLTPIPTRYGLPSRVFTDVITFFVETGMRSPSVNWEQI